MKRCQEILWTCIAMLAAFAILSALFRSDGSGLAPEIFSARISPAQEPILVPAPSRIPTLGYEVVNVYPHDRQAFTQGLVYHDGFLYESTGLNGRSSLRKVELETGAILKIVNLDNIYFGEGLALMDGKAFQLTWLSQIGFVYDQDTFERQSTFSYTGEGWGLTHDGRSLIMSDGSETIRFLDPSTFQVRRTLRVLVGNVPVQRLNELEYIDGEIWANIWLTDRIVRISPESGRVIAWVDLAGLLPLADRSPPVDVLNGIAWDAEGRRLFVTGKLWPKLFEILLKPNREPIIRRN
jgi:glutamine cyclotransferase